MSDIHGFYGKYMDMIQKIDLKDEDTLIINGDTIDRGPNGIKILQDVMQRPNVELIMGNHEVMMLLTTLAETEDDFAESLACWVSNGCAPTFNAFRNLSEKEQEEMIVFLLKAPFEKDLEVNGKKFHIVHGFPADNEYDEVWNRPEADTIYEPFQKDGIQLIIGHSPVYLFHGNSERQQVRYLYELEKKGEHLKIEHAPGFICTDCACGQDMKGLSALACLRLDDMAEFYIV
jgi:serine/threonine protein phosphatase 1